MVLLVTPLHDQPGLLICEAPGLITVLRRFSGLVMRALWMVLMLSGCGDPVDPCANVPCSEGRVCVVRDLDKVACEVPDAGRP